MNYYSKDFILFRVLLLLLMVFFTACSHQAYKLSPAQENCAFIEKHQPYSLEFLEKKYHCQKISEVQ